MDEEEDFTCYPPPGPPPLLSEDQMIHLARQGWLSLTLPDGLEETAADLFTTSSRFFELQDHEKAKFYPSKSGTEFGYYPVPEEKEYITFRSRVHTVPHAQVEDVSTLIQNLEDNTAQTWHEAGLFLFRILSDITRWSHLDLSIWNDILDGTLKMPESEDQVTYTLLRLFRYLPTTGFAEKHTDLGLLTICIGDRGGLQVLDRVESTSEKPIWVDPASQPRTVAILVGQTLRALSNGTMNAGVHRVVGNPNGRNSVVFALRHSSKHDVDFSLFGGEGRVSATELWKFIQVGKVNINLIKERREAQRAEFEAQKSRAKDALGISTGQG